MLVAIVGLANKGKSTFLSAATQTEAAIAAYPFTTINPNLGVAHVTTQCVCKDFNVSCKPLVGWCRGGVRGIPINLIDVAGLVPGAHEGRGLGNQFLSQIAQADGIICIADVSGGTDDEGKIVAEGTHDPLRDVEIVEREIDYWLAGVIERHISKIKGVAQPLRALAELLSGIRVSEEALKRAVAKLELPEPQHWSSADLLTLAAQLRLTKPMIVAANKIDSRYAKENFARLAKELPYKVLPVASDAELALRRAQRKGLIAYNGEIKVLAELPQPLKEAIDRIRALVADWGSTGVQEALNTLVFEVMGCVAVWPVENMSRLTDHFGNTLPHALLLNKGATPIDVAQAIHTELVQHFVCAIDVRTGQRLSRDVPLKHRDVIHIATR